jgi:phosphatidylglycerophosphatase A
MNLAPLAVGLATGFGVGYVPRAPGTVGSLLGLGLWALLPESAVVQGAVIVALFIVGTWSATVAERHLHMTDPGPVVIDEVLGMLMTLVLNPVSWLGALAGFLLFRLFDIVKPYPTNRFERLHGGLGVMADDAMAGVYANLALRGVLMLVAVLESGMAAAAP